MAKTKVATDSLEPKTFVEEKFLWLIQSLIIKNKETKRFPYKDQHFNQIMNVHKNYVSGIKRGRGIDSDKLILFCKALRLDMNQFGFDDAPFEYIPKSEKDKAELGSKNNFTARDNATVQLNSGVVYGDLHFGDKISYYDKVAEKAPPIKKKDFSNLLKDVKAIKKIADDEIQKTTKLTTEMESLTAKLTTKEKEVDNLQKELLAVYRKIK